MEHHKSGKISLVAGASGVCFVMALFPPLYGVLAFDLFKASLGWTHAPMITLWILFLGAFIAVAAAFWQGTLGIRSTKISDRILARIGVTLGFLSGCGLVGWLLFVNPFLDVSW